MRRLGTLTGIVAFVAAFTLAFAAAPKVAQAVHVFCGDTLPAGTTILDEDLNCSGTALTISANDITLDCANFKVSGDGTGFGISLTGVSGVTVRNCKVDNFGNNIVLSSSSGNFIENNRVTGATGGDGITLVNNSDGNVLVKNTAKDNSARGFELTGDSDGNLLQRNKAIKNGFRGYDLNSASDGNVLKKNKAIKNDSAGFVVSGASTGNILYRNKANDSEFEGFEILSSGNVLVQNTAKNNTTFGIDDAGGNVYIDNECSGNGTDANPAGLDPPDCI